MLKIKYAAQKLELILAQIVDANYNELFIMMFFGRCNFANSWTHWQREPGLRFHPALSVLTWKRISNQVVNIRILHYCLLLDRQLDKSVPLRRVFFPCCFFMQQVWRLCSLSGSWCLWPTVGIPATLMVTALCSGSLQSSALRSVWYRALVLCDECFSHLPHHWSVSAYDGLAHGLMLYCS